jgi:imidazolonepropionase-like amidohydrolase
LAGKNPLLGTEVRMDKHILVGWLVDGSGGPIREKIVLRIGGGRFTAVASPADFSPSELAQVIDLSHCTVLPPLVDCHLHLSMSGTTDPQAREAGRSAGYDELRPVMLRHLEDLFTHGVLAVRDGGDRGGFALRLRDDGGMHPAVIVRQAGRAWHRQGRYGALIGRHPGEQQSLAEACAGEEAAIDQIKLVNSGLNSLERFAAETEPQFTAAEIAEGVRIAVSQGRRVMAHANGVLPVRWAIEGGVHSIEHGYFMGTENLELLAEKGVVWVPTLLTMKAFATNPASGTKGLDRQVAEKNLAHQLAQLATARRLGVTVALGSDAGSPGVLHGESLVEEIKLVMKAGYTLAEAVRCVTVNGAQLLGLEEGFGPLVTGARANFLVARGGPAQLPRKLGFLEAIYLDGEPTALYRRNPVKHVPPGGSTADG